MHQDPHVSNGGPPGRDYELRPGLMLAHAITDDVAEILT